MEEQAIAESAINDSKNELSSEQNLSVDTNSVEIINREIKIGEIFSLSWNAFKNNLKFLLGVVLIYISIRFFELILQNIVGKEDLPRIAVSILFAALNMLISIGLISIFLKISRGSAVEFDELFGGKKYFWKFVGGSLLYGLIVFAGFILFIIPGIIWAYKYSLVSYFIVDKDMNPMDAIRESGRVTYGYKWNIFMLQAFVMVLYIVGLLCLGIGLIVSVVVAGLMSAFMYRALLGEKIYN
jgi:uncharacterized membrane protein